MKQYITPEEARQIILEHVAPLPVETVAHGAALGRTLARAIVSEVALPPFDNSAMDGYAVRAADVANASASTPVRLPVREIIAAGALPKYSLQPAESARIMTGAPLPRGADAVIMREETREADDFVDILATARPGQNIRRAGSDIARGETAIAAGALVRPAEWGLLASLNQARVEVFQRPRVALVVTGEELAAVGADINEGQIRDSNSYTLEGLALASGATVCDRRRTGDEVAAMQATLLELVARGDAIVTSGGVSAGDFDPVRDALREIAEVHFWKIATRPGGPVMFATLHHEINHEGRAIPIFGLPGNPVSVMVAWEQYVRPALLRMQGRRATRRVTLPVVLDETIRSSRGKTEYVRVAVRRDGDIWRAAVTGDQSSGRLSTMTRANALLVVPAALERVEAGQTLPAQMTDWPEMED